MTYDGRGNIYATTDGLTGITTTFDYDLIGRLLSSKSSNGFMQWVGYDDKGRRSSSSYSLQDGADTYRTTYLYGDISLGQHKSMLYGLALNDEQKIRYAYDGLCRLTERSIAENLGYRTKYRYLDNQGNTTTALLAGIKNGEDTEISYEYDRKGRIAEVYEGEVLKRLYYYTYDRLSAEYDPAMSEATYYQYDVLGNLDCKETYAMTTPWEWGPALRGSCYYYDPLRKDQLIGIETIEYDESGEYTSCEYRSFAYDEIGNPLAYDDKTMAWGFGRRLMDITSAGGLDVSYTYNDAGIRASKRVGNSTTTYTLSGTNILRQEDGTDTLDFFYDEGGDLYGLSHNGSEYWYVRNGQDDITGIIDNSGTSVVSYTYGTWGELLTVTGTLANTLGELNPFRYRGYYYDNETAFYYLNSRYYDPTTNRFINADGLISTGQGVAGYNMYTYCGNDPVNMVDPSGCAKKTGKTISKTTVQKAQATAQSRIVNPTRFDNPPTSDRMEYSGNYNLTDAQMQFNARSIYNSLKEEGWSHNAICAVLGNMQAESRLNPGRWQVGGPAYGLVQWDPGSRYLDWAAANGYNGKSIHGQLRRILLEVSVDGQPWTEGVSQWQGFRVDPYMSFQDFTTSDLSAYDLAIIFVLCYERPADQSWSVQDARGSLAMGWDDYFS